MTMPDRSVTAGSRLSPGGPGAVGEAELIALARRCWEADGGLPLATGAGFLRRRWFAPGVVTFLVRDAAGRLLGAVAVRPGEGGPVVTGLVDPAARGQGVGARLLDLGLDAAGRRGLERPAEERRPAPVASPPVVTVESEGLTAAAEALLVSRGLRQVFAEDVMRFDLAASPVPGAVWPDGVVVEEWTTGNAERFHAVHVAAFRERPGFPDPAAGEWIAETEEDDGFRADWSLLASVPGRGDVGFVTAAGGWIVQVGVRPAARRTGLAAALIRESLGRMAAAGCTEAWLDVNVDNPAAGLYRRLGFQDAGRRARFQRPQAPA